MEQELFSLLEHPSSPSIFSWVHFARSLVLCVYFVNRFFLVLFDGLLLTIVLSVFLRFTDSDFPLASSNSSYLIFISILLCTLLYSVILIRVNQTLEWGSLCSINYLQNTPLKLDQHNPQENP